MAAYGLDGLGWRPLTAAASIEAGGFQPGPAWQYVTVFLPRATDGGHKHGSAHRWESILK